MNEKADKYFGALHPEYETLTPEEKSKLIRDRVFIRDHIEEIKSWYEEAVGHGAKEGDPRIIEEAIRMAKSKMYIKMLYPDYSNLDPADRETIANNRLFINDHVEEIESWYEEAVGHGAKEGDPKIIEEAIRIIKSKTKQITPQQIGQATTNASVTIKQAVAQVENGEQVKGKEGEEVEENN